MSSFFHLGRCYFSSERSCWCNRPTEIPLRIIILWFVCWHAFTQMISIALLEMIISIFNSTGCHRVELLSDGCLVHREPEACTWRAHMDSYRCSQCAFWASRDLMGWQGRPRALGPALHSLKRKVCYLCFKKCTVLKHKLPSDSGFGTSLLQVALSTQDSLRTPWACEAVSTVRSRAPSVLRETPGALQDMAWGFLFLPFA